MVARPRPRTLLRTLLSVGKAAATLLGRTTLRRQFGHISEPPQALTQDLAPLGVTSPRVAKGRRVHSCLAPSQHAGSREMESLPPRWIWRVVRAPWSLRPIRVGNGCRPRAEAATPTADELADMADALPDAAQPSALGRDRPAILIQPMEGSSARRLPVSVGGSRATPRSRESCAHGDLQRIRTTANLPAWRWRERAFLRVPAPESGPHTTIAAYVAWREELHRFRRTNKLSDEAMA